jgi:hypothetical protein
MRNCTGLSGCRLIGMDERFSGGIRKQANEALIAVEGVADRPDFVQKKLSST